MSEPRKIKLPDSGKVVVLDLSRITILEFRVAVNAKSEELKQDEVLAKACGLKLKELQAMTYPDYRTIIDVWWKHVIEPADGVKYLEISETDLEKAGLKYGDSVELVPVGEKPGPNSQSAST